ncbi:hypothetical protein [Tsuneonella sp. SYSU-LHT278]|uniref:hypothetical protein n=1 Tax=Tsuneonella sediminis TaxID=3416089 RepID=UPI003F7A9E43
MKTSNTPLRTGLAAIAAATALSSTFAVAQTAAEAPGAPIVLPESSMPTPDPVPAAQPAIVVPEIPPVAVPETLPASVQTTSSASTPRASTPVRAAATPRSVTRPETASRSTVLEPMASPAADAGAPQSVDAASAPRLAEPAGVAALPPVEEMSPAAERQAQQGDVTEGLAQLLAGLLVAATAAGGLVLLVRRRRGRIATESVPTIQRPVVREPAVPASPASAILPAIASRPATDTGTGLPNQGAAIALPREAPTDFHERTSLLRRMVAARPDRANPFRSPGARLKRARLILASLGRTFENGPPRIDLSDYTSNWPALARYNRVSPA